MWRHCESFQLQGAPDSLTRERERDRQTDSERERRETMGEDRETTKATTIYFNEVVFHSVLGLT